MELNAQIKKYRTELQLSQEELAEKVFVTRQTISNWETGKSYPDIHSLLLLSSCFHVSLDQLVKGDIETMKEIINGYDIQEFKRNSRLFGALFIGLIVFAPIVIWWDKWYGTVLYGLLLIATMAWAIKIEKLKKKFDIQTYREIVAFSEGKQLDEIQKATEKGKRPYQKVLALLAGGTLALVALKGVTALMKLLRLI